MKLPEPSVPLFNSRRLPARLSGDQTALLLGFREHDLAPLIVAGLIKPLGNPAANAPKFFAAVVVEALAGDEKWLDRATRALAKYWSAKNLRKSEKKADSRQNATSLNFNVPKLQAAVDER